MRRLYAVKMTNKEILAPVEVFVLTEYHATVVDRAIKYLREKEPSVHEPWKLESVFALMEVHVVDPE